MLPIAFTAFLLLRMASKPVNVMRELMPSDRIGLRSATSDRFPNCKNRAFQPRNAERFLKLGRVVLHTPLVGSGARHERF